MTLGDNDTGLSYMVKHQVVNEFRSVIFINNGTPIFVRYSSSENKVLDWRVLHYAKGQNSFNGTFPKLRDGCLF
ncbi:hypothetical protein GCM10010912_68830 [Paenibacillus albidus]|uniref:Uncharacterized protein n=1 Tax=Paenibacillus albidus TaxID=2041023 RepID=A0A917LDW2_9BACL|nr:hypothetical protein GCM10010912_68830 [Paenibacillus albidus]